MKIGCVKTLHAYTFYFNEILSKKNFYTAYLVNNNCIYIHVSV